MLVVTAIAWAALLAVHAIGSGSGHHSGSVMRMEHMEHMEHGMAMPAMDGAHDPRAAQGGTAHMDSMDSPSGSARMFLTTWPFMLPAMMAPLLVPALRHGYVRSLPARRRRTLTSLLAAYAAVWSVGGLVLFALATALREISRSGAIPLAVGLFVVAVWELSPWRQRCLNRRQAHPAIAAFGRPADRDALRLGGTHALWCVGSCWALMLLPLLAGRWHLGAMVIVTLWIWAEFFEAPAVPAWRPRPPVTAVRIVAASARPLWRSTADGTRPAAVTRA